MFKVLIVEDDPMVAMINFEYLSSINMVKVVGHASSKDDALNFLEKNEVDLILLDIFLGGDNGLDILKEIRELGYTTDVIMITSANGRDEITKAFSLGSVDYLIKPFDLDRFKIAIGKSMKRREILSSGTFTQEDVDTLSKNLKAESDTLPKGLNSKTLEIIRKKIENLDNDFTIKDICETTDISNVTTKKYLNYLEERGEIKGYVNYGNVGRPLHTYKKRH